MESGRNGCRGSKGTNKQKTYLGRFLSAELSFLTHGWHRLPGFSSSLRIMFYLLGVVDDMVHWRAHWWENYFTNISNIYILLYNISNRAFSMWEICSLLNLKPPSTDWAPETPLIFNFHLEWAGQNINQKQKWMWNTCSLEYKYFTCRFKCFKIQISVNK